MKALASLLSLNIYKIAEGVSETDHITGANFTDKLDKSNYFEHMLKTSSSHNKTSHQIWMEFDMTHPWMFSHNSITTL